MAETNGAGLANGDAIQGEARALATLLIALARQLFKLDHDAVEKLPLAQLRVCGMLYDGPRPMSTLSRELGVSLSAMTQIADRLERARLVRRVAEDADRRIRTLQLTPHGARLMRRREDARIQRLLCVLQQVPPRTRKEIVAAVGKLVDACSIPAREHAVSSAGNSQL